MSEVDKNQLIKNLRSKIRLGVYGKGFLHGTIFIGFFFLALFLGASASARPAALDLAEQKNSYFYEQMDQIKREMKHMNTVMKRIDEIANGVKEGAHEVNRYIRSEEIMMEEPEMKESATEPVLQIPVNVTTYNAEVGQTDASPCKAGGTRLNICDLSDAGHRIIAVSQDLAKWSMIGKDYGAPFESGDVVELFSEDHPHDSRCNGEFVIADAMNIRFRKKIDLFMKERGENISCKGTIVFKGKNINDQLQWANIDSKN